MKFAHSFAETLAKEDFPPDWQAAAIQYRQLKKCIKRVQRELLELGLDADTLKTLVAEGGAAEDAVAAEDEGKPVLTYMFDGTVQSYQPKLMLTVYEADGLHFNLGLTGETKEFLERLVKERGIQKQPEKHDPEAPDLPEDEPSSLTSSASSSISSQPDSVQDAVRTVEIPLTADVEFFHNLTSELASLEAVQAEAASSIEKDIVTLGTEVTAVASPKLLNPRSDLYKWREIFRIYLDIGIFFSNLEVDQHKERTVEDAQQRLERFRRTVEVMGLLKRFKDQRSPRLYAGFMGTNQSMLRVLHFQAINKVAMRKILKKFDKRTALSTKTTFPTFVASTPFLASDLAKALCYTMQTRVLEVIPQLDDYLCPVCQSIAIKPVRLECSHLFCIRCLVKLQREGKKFCPMCRGDVVMKADATNLDLALLNFLRGYFPKEVKEKQKENDREVVIEQWRRVHQERFGEGPCVVM